MIYIQTIIFFIAVYWTFSFVVEMSVFLKFAKSITVSAGYMMGFPFIWTAFFFSMTYVPVTEPQAYDYHINVDNDSIYITSPGIDGGQTQHYEISWDDSISVKDIIMLDNQ